jgi:hypothetical protein
MHYVCGSNNSSKYVLHVVKQAAAAAAVIALFLGDSSLSFTIVK